MTLTIGFNSSMDGVSYLKDNKNKPSRPLLSLLKQDTCSFSGAPSAKKPLSQIAFGLINKVTSPDFPKAFVNDVQKELDCCVYGKKDLIDTLENNAFKVVQKSDGFDLIGFHNRAQDTEDCIHGICEELSFKVGKKLEEKYGDQYLFADVEGFSMKYFMKHHYIIAFKRTPDNEKKLETITNNSEFFDKTSRNPDATDLDKSDAAKMLHKPDDLKGALLIDPSFNLIEEVETNEKFKDFIHMSIKTFDYADPYKEPNYLAYTDLGETIIPLGYPKDLTPECLDKFDDNDMFSIKLLDDKVPAEAHLVSTRLADGLEVIDLDEFETSLPENHSLRRFFDKIRQDIHP